MEEWIQKGFYPETTRYTRMNNRKLYSGYKRGYITIPEIVLDYLEGKRGTIWDIPNKKDITKELLANYIAQCFREDVEKLETEEFIELLHLVGPRVPRFYEDVYRGGRGALASRKRKAVLKERLVSGGKLTPEIEKQNKGVEMGPGWSLSALRKFYKLHTRRSKKIFCLGCRNEFLSQSSRICPSCKKKDLGELQEFGIGEGKSLENYIS